MTIPFGKPPRSADFSPCPHAAGQQMLVVCRNRGLVKGGRRNTERCLTSGVRIGSFVAKGAGDGDDQIITFKMGFIAPITARFPGSIVSGCKDDLRDNSPSGTQMTKTHALECATPRSVHTQKRPRVANTAHGRLGQTHLRKVHQRRKCSYWLISLSIRIKNHDNKHSSC